MSTTVGARLKYLSGLSGATIGAMLVVIGGAGTVASALVAYSGLPTGTVAQHLLVDRVAGVRPPTSRLYRVWSENRRQVVAIERRQYSVIAEQRRAAIAAENRRALVLSENRRIIVPLESRRVAVS